MSKPTPGQRVLGQRDPGPFSQQQKIPTFPTDSWVRLDYPGPRVGGQVTADVTFAVDGANPARFISFKDPETQVEYTVPPELLARTLSPGLETLAKLILAEDLFHTNMTIEETRDLVMRVVTHVEEDERGRQDNDEARNT